MNAEDARLEQARDVKVAFGRHKGSTLSQIGEADPSYLRWLAGERRKDAKRDGFKVDPAIEAAAKLVLADVELYEDDQRWLKAALGGRPDNQGETLYVTERLGDAKGLSGHQSLEEALAHLASEYPKDGDGDRSTPDPEDDRILIWEVLPTGHKKVVWHFSGWHWDADEFGLEQGCLADDEESLYALANY